MARTATPAPTPELPGWIRSLLPGILSDPGDEDRSRRDRIVDAAMYTIAFLLGALGLADTWAQHPGWLRVVDPALGLAALASLHWRRSHPAAVGIATAVVSIVFVATTGPALIALFNAAVRARGRALWLILFLCIPVSFGIPLLYTPADEFWIEVVLGFLASGVVVGWGLFVRARRELVQALRERTERVEVQTREAERQRIAREMHDVLAHRLSLLSVHAGALEFRPDAPAAEVGEAAGVIRRSAHAALEELREVIGVLRHEGGDGSLEPPQPTLADIPGLVEESRTAGMSVELELAVTGEPFPAALGRTAYRIVQEGLTNARKHAPGAAVDVSLAGTGESLTVEVRSHPPVGVTAAVVPGGGAGLVGLAERVTLAGGALEHGVGAAGAFVLRARLPR